MLVLSLPSIDGAITSPSAAITPRRPISTSSRPMISAAIHGETRSDAEQRDQHAGDEQLVRRRVEERAELARDVPAPREAPVDPVRRGGDAEQHGGEDRGVVVVADQDQRHETGVSRIRVAVPAARKRAERSPPRVTFGIATRRADATRAPSGRSGRALRARARRRARPVAVAQCGLDRGDPARGHAQLAHAEPGEQHRGVGVAGELAADADPAAVRLGGRDDAAISARTGGRRAVEQRRERRVAALGRHRVLGEVVGADGEEVDLGGEGVGLRARAPGPRPSRRPRAARALPSSARAASSSARAARSSSSVATIGNITLSGCSRGDAQDRAQLGARTARARRARGGCRGRRGTGCPPAPGAGTGAACRRRRRACGRSRGRPSSASAISRQHRDLLVLVGGVARSRKRNSVRSRPTPSAPCATALARLGGAADVGEDLDPAAVGERAGLARRARAPRPRSAASASRRAAELGGRLRRPGRRRRSRASPSSASGVPVGDREHAAPRPTTAGMPSARATIAACPVAPPRAVAIAQRALGVQRRPPRRASARRRARCPARASTGAARRAGELGEHAARDVLDVDGALAQVGVVERAERRGRLARRPLPRPRRRRARRRCAAAPGSSSAASSSSSAWAVKISASAAPPRAATAPARPRAPPARPRAPRRAAPAPPPAARPARVGDVGLDGARAAARAPIAMPRARARATPPQRAARAAAVASPAAGRAARGAGRGRAAVAGAVRRRRRSCRPRARERVERRARPAARSRARRSRRPGGRRASASAGEAAGVGRAAAARSGCATVDAGVEPGDRADEPRRRARVQAEAVLDGQRAASARRRRSRPAAAASAPASSSPSCAVFIASAPRASRATSSSVAPAARARRRRDRALDQRRRREQHRPAVRLEHLDRHLRAHQRAAEVHQHEHAVGRADRLDGGHHARGVGADRAVVEPAGRLDRDLLAAHLPRELGDALGQRRAVGDDDEADHGALARPDARWSISTGCTDRTPVACWICQRQVSESHTERSGGLRDLAEQPGADVHRDVVLLALEPVGPGDAAAVASLSITCSSGISAIRSSAGLPIPCPCCWHGAW